MLRRLRTFASAFCGAASAACTHDATTSTLSNSGATLGRVLFFDTRLSANDGTSCGSSHNQAVAFGDTPALSLGFNGALTTRHSPSLDNARFYKRGRFFWDKRAAPLEAQVLGPIQNSGVWQPGDQRRSCVCCANCHTTVAQVMYSTHNTGLDASRVNIGAGNGVQASSSLDVRLRASDGSPRRLRPTAV